MTTTRLRGDGVFRLKPWYASSGIVYPSPPTSALKGLTIFAWIREEGGSTFGRIVTKNDASHFALYYQVERNLTLPSMECS